MKDLTGPISSEVPDWACGFVFPLNKGPLTYDHPKAGWNMGEPPPGWISYGANTALTTRTTLDSATAQMHKLYAEYAEVIELLYERYACYQRDSLQHCGDESPRFKYDSRILADSWYADALVLEEHLIARRLFDHDELYAIGNMFVPILDRTVQWNARLQELSPEVLSIAQGVLGETAHSESGGHDVNEERAGLVEQNVVDPKACYSWRIVVLGTEKNSWRDGVAVYHDRVILGCGADSIVLIDVASEDRRDRYLDWHSTLL